MPASPRTRTDSVAVDPVVITSSTRTYVQRRQSQRRAARRSRTVPRRLSVRSRALRPAESRANIDVASIEEAERIFAELSAGGKVVAPIGETFWAQRWGMLVDRYGKPWMVNCMKPTA